MRSPTPEPLAWMIDACLSAMVILPLMILALLYTPDDDASITERIDALEITVDALARRIEPDQLPPEFVSYRSQP